VNERRVEFLDSVADGEAKKEIQEIFLTAGEESSEYADVVLERLRRYRAAHASDDLTELATIIYEGLVNLGEEKGDMQLVHLAVDSRDALIG
jgi:hypothetical protein